MNISPDYIIERKSHKSQIRKWKLASIFLIIAIIGISIKKPKLTSMETVQNSEYIGSVLIDNILFEDHKRDKKLEKIVDDKNIKALIVEVNSPGGTVVGAERIYNILRKISAKKPVVIVMGTVAASGGYLISLGGDYIISHNGTITGSIGVIFQTAEITELAEKLGIKFNNFKSNELKGAPNPTEKLTPIIQEAIMENIYDTYDYFIELVARRRNLPLEEVRKLADGRVYSGRQALKLKLIDAVGETEDAVKWLREVKKIDAKLQVKEVKLTMEPSRFLEMIFDEFDSIVPGFFKSQFFDKLYGKRQGMAAMAEF